MRLESGEMECQERGRWMSQVLLLSAGASPVGASPVDQERCRGFVDFLRRRSLLTPAASATAGTSPGPTGVAEVAASLLRLNDKGLLSYTAAADTAVEVFYTPSREAVMSVLEAGPDSGFPEPVQKKQMAALRTSPGALFRFPLESGTGVLEVFITDWSPCPAACAVAIHRSHPLVRDLDKPEGPCFTGLYVRHPLTGDLLPVWIADWVRPDFGTGAVLVNPAHDPTDLAFGRATGLPIRFALVPSGYDGSPATWPDPPLVKTGQTVRTGPYDGLPAEEAAGRYFEVLAERGLAERHRDVQAGRWKIARLLPDPEGGLAWSPSRWTVLPLSTGSGARGVRGVRGIGCEGTDLLAAALAGAENPSVLVCPAGEQAGELLAFRLLSGDLAARPAIPSAVFLVQKVQESKVEAPPEVVRLAALMSAPVNQVAVIKQQTVEQVQRFLRVHRELLGEAPEAGSDGQENAAERAFGKVKAAICESDPAKAFGLLQQAQKQLRDLPAAARAGALPGYFVLAEVLAGLERPPGLNACEVWSRLP